MHFRRNRVKLDLAQHMGKCVKSDFIYGKSDCNSSYLELEILNNGTVVNLEGYTAICSIVKSDNKCIFNECSIANTTNGIIEILFTSQALASDGANYLQLILKNGETVITSPIVIYEVAKTILSESKEIIQSTNEFPILIDLIDKVDKQNEECIKIHKEMTKNEGSRVEKENERQASELKRITTNNEMIKSEDLRILAELERNTQESKRRKFELERIEFEKVRNTNEDQRIAKDVQRDSFEISRNEAELVRISNEEERKSLENNRINLETSRIKAEEVREANELTRKNQEEVRQQSMSNIRNEFDRLTTAKQQDAEVILARQSADGTTYENLKARLDKMESQAAFGLVIFETIEG